MKKKSGGCGCLGAPLRALSRACDSACDLYVRGMSGCARGLPSGSSSAAGIVGRGGFGGSPLRFRVSSDKADDDLVRAASSASSASKRQRRVAAEPQPEPEDQAVGYGAGKMGSAGAGGLVGFAGSGVRPPARKRTVAVATMGTIAEDAPCDFGPAPALPPR